MSRLRSSTALRFALLMLCSYGVLASSSSLRCAIVLAPILTSSVFASLPPPIPAGLVVPLALPPGATKPPNMVSGSAPMTPLAINTTVSSRVQMMVPAGLVPSLTPIDMSNYQSHQSQKQQAANAAGTNARTVLFSSTGWNVSPLQSMRLIIKLKPFVPVNTFLTIMASYNAGRNFTPAAMPTTSLSSISSITQITPDNHPNQARAVFDSKFLNNTLMGTFTSEFISQLQTNSTMVDYVEIDTVGRAGAATQTQPYSWGLQRLGRNGSWSGIVASSFPLYFNYTNVVTEIPYFYPSTQGQGVDCW